MKNAALENYGLPGPNKAYRGAGKPAKLSSVPKPPPVGRVHTAAAYLLSLWRLPLLDSARIRLCLFGGIVAICAIRAFVGLYATKVAAWDAFIFLDGAWRVLNGQRPHTDFYTGLGPFSYLLTAAGLFLSHGQASGLTLAHSVFGGVIGVWAYAVCRRRLQAVPTILLCVAIVLLAVAPTSVGGWPTTLQLTEAGHMNSPEYLTAGMFYNRWGYALLWLLLIETLSPRVSNRWVEFWGGLSTGVIIGLLLFLKVNYFASAVFLVGTLWICKAQSKERWVGIATGSAAIFLVFCAYLGFTLTPMWEDLTTVAQTKQLAIGPFLRETLSLNVFPFVAFILVSLFLFRPAAFRLDEISVALAGLSLSLGGLFLYLTHWPHHAILANVAVLSLLVLVSTVGFRRDVLAVNLGGLCACFAGLCLLSTNWQFYQLPLNTVVTILVIDWLASRPAGGWLPMRAAVVLSGLALFVSSVSMDARGLAFGFQQRAFGGNAYVGFNDSRLAGFTGDERAYVESINDGLSLLRKYKKADDTLVVVDYANPFSYTLGIKPSSGGATWLHYGTDLDMSRPSPERVFGGSSLAMVPKVFYVPVIQEPVQRIFRPFLLKHYEPIAESPRWWLYRRVGQ